MSGETLSHLLRYIHTWGTSGDCACCAQLGVFCSSVVVHVFMGARCACDRSALRDCALAWGSRQPILPRQFRNATLSTIAAAALVHTSVCDD